MHKIGENMLDLTKIQPLIDMALAEDIADGDHTSESCIESSIEN